MMSTFYLWLTLAALALPVAFGQPNTCQAPTPQACTLSNGTVACCPKDACLDSKVGCCPQASQTVCPVSPGSDPTNLACCESCNNFLDPSFTTPSNSTDRVCCPSGQVCPNLLIPSTGPVTSKLCCRTSCLPALFNGANVTICCPREGVCGKSCCLPDTTCVNDQCCPSSQVCVSTTGVKTCCSAASSICMTDGTCCKPPNSMCPNLANPAVSDCCPPGNCQPVLPLATQAKACCKETCLDLASLPINVTGCCKETCSTFTDAAGAPTSGVCCPWGAQTIQLNGAVVRVCCPPGSKVQSDGSCKTSTTPCTQPNVTCPSWPSLTPDVCCPGGQCLPVLPLSSAGLPRACCGAQGPVCLDFTQLPNKEPGCCKTSCSIYTIPGTTPTTQLDNVCCPWDFQLVPATGALLKVCCPPEQKAFPDGTCCNKTQLCSVTGKPDICCPANATCNTATGQCVSTPPPTNCTQPNVTCPSWPSLTPDVCCPDGQCLPVLPLSSTGLPKACCGAQGPVCLDPNQLPNNVRGCCNETCSTFINAAGTPISGVCCPWGAQTIQLNGALARICCPPGTTVQPNGSCKASTTSSNCTAPNIPCNSWPAMTPGECCPDTQCLPVLPFSSTGLPKACCGSQGPVCLDPNQLPNTVRGCCNETCSTFISSSGATTQGVCCPWGASTFTNADGTTTRICCPPGTTAQPDGTCCKNTQLCPQPNNQPAICCPTGSSCQPVPSTTGTTKRICCPDGTVAQANGTCCKQSQLCPQPNNQPAICCPAGSSCNSTTGQCTTSTTLPNNCTAPNVTCAFWPSFAAGDCCRNGTCLSGWNPFPPPGQVMNNGLPACCPLPNICTPYNAPATAPSPVCCKSPCSLLVNTAATQPTTSRTCCPWTPQPIPGTNKRICCPDGTVVQADGSCCKQSQLCTPPTSGQPVCCPAGTTCNFATGQCSTAPPPNCTLPNTTCSFWPSLLPGDCCRKATCRPVLNPLPPPNGVLSNVSACCPVAKRCRRYSAVPALKPIVCCNGTCANVTWADGNSTRACCPYPTQLGANGVRYCCPPNNVVLQPGGQCCPKAAYYVNPTQKQSCCPDGSIWFSNLKTCCKTTNICMDAITGLKTCCKEPHGCATFAPPNTPQAQQKLVCCPKAKRCQFSAKKWECCTSSQTCDPVFSSGFRRCKATLP